MFKEKRRDWKQMVPIGWGQLRSDEIGYYCSFLGLAALVKIPIGGKVTFYNSTGQESGKTEETAKRTSVTTSIFYAKLETPHPTSAGNRARHKGGRGFWRFFYFSVSLTIPLPIGIRPKNT